MSVKFHTGGQLQFGDLVSARRNTKDGPLASLHSGGSNYY